MLKCKGQITAEFMAVMAIVTMIFLVAFTFIGREHKVAARSIWSMDAEDTARKLAAAINSAYLAGDGALTNVTLPKRLVGGVNYTMTVRERLVSVTVPAYNDTEFEWKFQTAGVEGAASGLSVMPGTVGIQNDNGTIRLTSYG